MGCRATASLVDLVNCSDSPLVAPVWDGAHAGPPQHGHGDGRRPPEQTFLDGNLILKYLCWFHNCPAMKAFCAVTSKTGLKTEAFSSVCAR